MGLLTKFFFGLGDLFVWTFENILVPIAPYADWIIFIVGAGLLLWWLSFLAIMGSKNEKTYKGW